MHVLKGMVFGLLCVCSLDTLRTPNGHVIACRITAENPDEVCVCACVRVCAVCVCFVRACVRIVQWYDVSIPTSNLPGVPTQWWDSAGVELPLQPQRLGLFQCDGSRWSA